MRFTLIRIICIVLIFIANNISGNIISTNLHSTGHVGLCESFSATTHGASVVVFSFKGSFTYDNNFVPHLVRQDDEDQKESAPYAILYDLTPSVAFGITDLLDISLSQPLYFDILEGPLPTGGPGDLYTAIKCRIPGKGIYGCNGAFLTAITYPYSDNTNGYFLRHMYYLPENSDTWLSKPVAFYTARKPSLSILAIGTLHRTLFELHANVGACIPFNKKLDQVLLGAFGMEIHPSEWIGIFTDLYCEPRITSITEHGKITSDPIRLSVGVTMKASGGTHFTIGSSIRVSSDKVQLHYFDNSNKLLIHSRSEPLWKAFLQVSWRGSFVRNDRDHDQIIDKYDECPDIPEDFDGFKDNDGCPDNDNDQDNIPDETDSCKNIPEDIDGEADLDGCPDRDNDEDGILDTLDKCPDTPEDKDGFYDDDGCPDFDNDNDGIPDSLDKCIMIPEDKDGFNDDDGCADSDNDIDGIPDSIDQCPDSVGLPEKNGCPEPTGKGKEIMFGRLILPGVRFKTGTAELTSSSSADLDRLYTSLHDWPDIKIEIRVHVDNSIIKKKAVKLSKQRADTVITYLKNRGIAVTRLKGVGMGSTSPIADNETIEGRMLNNRVEIHRIRDSK